MMIQSGSRPWHDVGAFFRERFGGPVRKILLNTGPVCPHRLDGSGGCIFCDELSILPKAIRPAPPLADQLQRGVAAARQRGHAGGFIAYFQRGTNTAAPVEQLREWWTAALGSPGVVALAVGTRPDCLPPPVRSLLAEIATQAPVFVDLGLQSAHDATLARICRGHDAACFARAVEQLAGFPNVLPVAHLILGLPGEDRAMMAASFRFTARLPLHGVKIHHLQVIRGTPLEADFRAGTVPVLTPEVIVPLLADALEELPWPFVIHRLVGDQPAESLLAPRWHKVKNQVLEDLAAEFRRRGTRQGSKFEADTPHRSTRAEELNTDEHG
jgi:radical SAM protein (TIGR01212 family)